MIQQMAALFALGALFIAGCNLRPRPFPWIVGSDGCRYEGSMYSHGSTACQAGIQYRCDDGQWKGWGAACAENLPVGSRGCDLRGDLYSSGSASCQAGSQYRCDDGVWRNLGVACADSEADTPRLAPEGRTCLYNGATVATQSSICKAGITYRCEDGEWRNLGSACR